MAIKLFDLDGLTPHGVCLLWRDDLFLSLAVSDGAIAISYLSISIAIIFFIIKRKDMYLRWVAVSFALFILLCASSHLMDLWTLWVPDYGIQVVVKAATALVSVFTALVLWPLFPHALSLPSAARMSAVNVVLSREIEERKLAETTLRRTEAELRAANKELDSFAYAVSHDLRAPLRAMTGFSQALAEDFGESLDGEARSHLTEIAYAGRHMGELIDGLLTLSRATRGELQRTRIDLSAMAEGICRELQRTEPDRQVSWSVEPGLDVWGDQRMIELVLTNLLGNAWKYTGLVAQSAVRLYKEFRNGVPYICLSDNGAGFSQDHADKLFKPFQRLHRQDEFPGIGIGLSTVFRIIQRHGGDIQAEGTPGGGATFRFFIPEPEDGSCVDDDPQ